MRRSLLIAVLILLAAGVIASGAVPLDDAKKAVAAADKKVVAGGTVLQSIAKSFSQRLAALADVSKQLDAVRDRQRQAAPIIAKAIESTNAELTAAKAEAAAAQRALREAEAALSVAKGDVGPKRAAIERAASAERRAFEASDAFKQANDKVTAADAALARERSRLDAAMKGDPKMAALIAAATKTEADLNAARAKQPADDVATAEASARWIEAKNALTAVQNEAYSEDGAFAAAMKASTAAMAARAALSDAFDKSILGQPGVAEAQLALRDAQNAVKLAEANEAAARDAVERAGRWLIMLRNNADVIGRIAKDSDAGLADVQVDLKRALDHNRAMGQDLNAATTGLLSIRDDLKDATAAIVAAGKK